MSLPSEKWWSWWLWTGNSSYMKCGWSIFGALSITSWVTITVPLDLREGRHLYSRDLRHSAKYTKKQSRWKSKTKDKRKMCISDFGMKCAFKETPVYLTGVGSSLQVPCTDHPGGDEALVNLWLVAGLSGEQRHHGRAQNQAGLPCENHLMSGMHYTQFQM